MKTAKTMMSNKKIRKILLTILWMVISGYCAEAQTGIRFETARLTWPEVLSKAKTEHKYIFVDCYATWCGPCKQMDKTVYPLKDVGDIYNAQFICVKIQMDRTKADNKETRERYSMAAMLENSYHVNSYPTFLFFDPDGKPMHKAVGSSSPKEFILLAREAQNPDKQDYSILKNFMPGKLDTAEEKRLARSFYHSDKELAAKLMADYLERIPESQLSTTDNKTLMGYFQFDPQVLALAVQYLRSVPDSNLFKGEDGHFLLDLSKQSPVQKIISDHILRLNKADFSKPENLKFIARLAEDTAIQRVALNYIEHLDKDQFRQEKNLKFIASFRANVKIETIAKEFIDQIPEDQAYKKELISFIAAFTTEPNGRSFHFFYTNADKIDAIMNDPDYAQGLVTRIINNIEFAPLLEQAKESGMAPDFNNLFIAVERKHNTYYARRLMLFGEVAWYAYLVLEKKDDRLWPDLFQARIKSIDLISADHIPYWSDPINNVCYEWFFKRCDNKQQLEKAAGWMKEVVSRNPDNDAYIDTYACLLYKAGNKVEGMDLEKKAEQIAMAANNPNYIDLFKTTLNKMGKDKPIWLERE